MKFGRRCNCSKFWLRWRPNELLCFGTSFITKPSGGLVGLVATCARRKKAQVNLLNQKMWSARLMVQQRRREFDHIFRFSRFTVYVGLFLREHVATKPTSPPDGFEICDVLKQSSSFGLQRNQNLLHLRRLPKFILVLLQSQHRVTNRERLIELTSALNTLERWRR